MKKNPTLLHVYTNLLNSFYCANNLTHKLDHFGGVMVSVLAIVPKDHGYKPGRGDGF
jgi:hypothetical protein